MGVKMLIEVDGLKGGEDNVENGLAEKRWKQRHQLGGYCNGQSKEEGRDERKMNFQCWQLRKPEEPGQEERHGLGKSYRK